MTIPRPLEVKALAKYRIWVRYSDGEAGEVDLSDLAGKGVFKYWEDGANFQRVYIAEGGGIAWNDDLEICPDATYMRLTGKTVEELFPALQPALRHV